MLNLNKIESDINFRNLSKAEISGILGIPYMTAVNRMKNGNWTPDDVEKFADYFGRTINYYFDREESEKKNAPEVPGATPVTARPYAQLEQHNIGSDPKMAFNTCQDCIEKQREINDLRRLVDLQDKLIATLEGKKKPNGTSG